MAPSCSDLLDLNEPLGQGIAGIWFLQFIILGVLTTFGIYRVHQAKKAWKDSNDQYSGAQNPPTSLLLPIYINAMSVMCVILLISCILHIFSKVSYLGENSLGYSIHLAVVLGLKQVCYEVCTFSLMSAGAGQRTYIRSFLVAFVWGAITSIFKAFSFYYITRDFTLAMTLEYVWGGALFIFYLLLWILPNATLFPHRPASLNCGRFWTAMYALFLISTALRHQLYEAGYCIFLSHNWIIVVVAPIVIYRVSCDDSFYWQGATDMKVASNSIASVLSGSLNPALAMDLVTAETFGVHLINFSALTIDEAKRSKPAHEGVMVRNHSNSDRDSRGPANHFIIDSGSMAKVYRGKYRQDSVAIKLIYAPELTTELVRNLFQEASIMASLGHTHVTSVFGVCVMPPAVALCMELCIGSLHDMLHKPCVYDALFMYQQRLNRIRRIRYGEPVTPFYSLNVQPRYDNDPEYIDLITKDPSQFDRELRSYLDNIAPDHLTELNKGVPPTFNSFTPPPILPPLPLDVQLRLAIDCITGLAFLHTQEKPVVHLDIKSGNFLVGRNGLVKLADLELATVLPSQESIIAPFVQESTYHTCDDSCLELINIADCGLNDGHYEELSVLLERLDEAEEEAATNEQQHQHSTEGPAIGDSPTHPVSLQEGRDDELQAQESIPHNKTLPRESDEVDPDLGQSDIPHPEGANDRGECGGGDDHPTASDNDQDKATSPRLSPLTSLTIKVGDDDNNPPGGNNATEQTEPVRSQPQQSHPTNKPPSRSSDPTATALSSSPSNPRRLTASPSRQAPPYPTSMGYPYELPIKNLKPVLCPHRFYFTYKQSSPINTFTYETYPLYRVSDPILHSPFRAAKPIPATNIRPQKPLGFNQPSRIKRKIARKRIQQQQQSLNGQLSRHPSSHALYTGFGEPATPRSLLDREYTFDGGRPGRGLSQSRRRDASMDRYGRDSGGIDVLPSTSGDHYDDSITHAQSHTRLHRMRDSSVDRSISRYRSVSRERDTRKYKYLLEDGTNPTTPGGEKADKQVVQIHTQPNQPGAGTTTMTASVVTVASPTDAPSLVAPPHAPGSNNNNDPLEKKVVTLHRPTCDTVVGDHIASSDELTETALPTQPSTGEDDADHGSTDTPADLSTRGAIGNRRTTVIVHKGKSGSQQGSTDPQHQHQATAPAEGETNQHSSSPSLPASPSHLPPLQVPQDTDTSPPQHSLPPTTPSSVSHSSSTPTSQSTPRSRNRSNHSITPSRSSRQRHTYIHHHRFDHNGRPPHPDHHVLLDDELGPDDHLDDHYDSFEDDDVSSAANNPLSAPPLHPSLSTGHDDTYDHDDQGNNSSSSRDHLHQVCGDANDHPHDDPRCPFYSEQLLNADTSADLCKTCLRLPHPSLTDTTTNAQADGLDASEPQLPTLPSSLSTSTTRGQYIITETPSYKPPIMPPHMQGPLASPQPPGGMYPAFFGSIPSSHYTSASAHALFNLHTSALNITKYNTQEEVEDSMLDENLSMEDQHLGWGLRLAHGIAAHDILYTIDRSHHEIRLNEQRMAQEGNNSSRQSVDRNRSVLSSLTTPRGLGGKGLFQLFNDSSSVNSRPGSPTSSPTDALAPGQPAPMLDLLSLNEDNTSPVRPPHPQQHSDGGRPPAALSDHVPVTPLPADGKDKDAQSTNTSSLHSSLGTTPNTQPQYPPQQTSRTADEVPKKCLCFSRRNHGPRDKPSARPSPGVVHHPNDCSTHVDSMYDQSSYCDDPTRMTMMTTASVASSPGLPHSPPPTVSIPPEAAYIPKSASAVAGPHTRATEVEMTALRGSGGGNGAPAKSVELSNGSSTTRFPQTGKQIQAPRPDGKDDQQDNEPGWCCCFSPSQKPTSSSNAGGRNLQIRRSSKASMGSNESNDYVVQIHPPGYELFTSAQGKSSGKPRNPCEWLSSRFGATKYDGDDEIVVPQCLYWLAPEIIRKEPFGLAADTYSIACVLWEIVCRKVPYREMEEIIEDEHRMEVERRKQLAKQRRDMINQGLPCDIPDNIHATPLKPPEEVLGEMIGYHHFRPSIPSHAHAGLADIIRQCWHHDPSMRPSLVTVLLQLRVLYHQLGFSLGKDDWYGIEQTKIECENQGVDINSITVVLE